MKKNIKRKKILHIAECAGGVDRYLKLLLPLLQDNYEQIFICSQHFDAESYYGIVDYVEQIKMEQSFSPFKIYRQVQRIKQIINRICPDIVYCHSSFAGGLGRLAPISCKCKIVYNPHGWAFNMPYGLKPTVYKLLERMLVCKTDKIVAISDFEKNNAIRNHIGNDALIKVIYSGIDLEDTIRKSTEGNVTREMLNIPMNAFLIGVSARLCETKAPEIFVEAASIIKKQIDNAYFIFIGDGELRSDVECLIRKKGLSDSFRITGWVNNPLAYIKLLNVGLLLSRWEGFGFALTEYMKLCVPIVATNVCAIPNLIKNEYNGLLVPMDDYIAVADAVVRIFRQPSIKDHLIGNGLQVVNTKFDIHRVANQHIELFEQLLS